jgi:hypothetical protein
MHFEYGSLNDKENTSNRGIHYSNVVGVNVGILFVAFIVEEVVAALLLLGILL